MGCGASHRRRSAPMPGPHDLKLSSCKLTFNCRQLNRISRKFEHFLTRNSELGREKGRRTSYINVVVERLIQRLVCNVGKVDSRFSSAFLINLEPLKNYNLGPKKNLKFKYLVRLDLISSPALYPEFFEPPVRVVEGPEDESLPGGFAKIRVHGEFLEKWMGFISSTGFLRRDKIQERFIELLARAAAKPTEPLTPAEVDESKHCGSPGKVVDPITLYYILKTPSRNRFFFGSAECNESRFPDPRDFRIAIVQGVPEIRLHISFLSPAARSISSDDDVEVSITLGIGVVGWPSSTDFPFRLPLDHVDVILGYQAAQLDYYLVPKGPHTSVYCEDRMSTWEIRAFAPEMFLLHHYSPTSVIFRIYKILAYILEVLKARGVKTINRYILKNCLFFELEMEKNMQHWAPQLTAHRVLSIFDRLLLCLRCQNFPSYMFPTKNLLLQDDVFDEDYASDGDILENYLRLLHNDGGHFEAAEMESDPAKDLMENTMLRKWEDVVSSMLPPMSNRSSRLSVVQNSPASIVYTCHQIEYVALLLRQVLNLHKIQKGKEKQRHFPAESKGNVDDVSTDSTSKDDFVYLLQMIFEQAKQNLLTSLTTSTDFVSGRKKGRMIKLDQVLMGYDLSTSMIIDDIGRSEDFHFRFSDDTSIVVKIIEYLYKAIDSDGKVLGRVLRPYLNQIFRGSHENCWFLPEWKKKTAVSEIQAMQCFGHLVLTGKMDPLSGLLNAAGKGWNWAINTLQILRFIMEDTSTRIIVGKKIDSNDSGLRLIFTPEPEKTVRINVTLMRDGQITQTTEEATACGDRQATIKSFQDMLGSAISSENLDKKASPPSHIGSRLTNSERQAPHLLLRDGNPFTVASMEVRRQGNHRGLGSIVQALISLQKLTVLQEISQYLPDRERIRVLSDIKKLSREIQRLTIENHKKNHFSRSGKKKNRFSFRKPTGPHVLNKISMNSNKRKPAKQVPNETYTSRDEFVLAESHPETSTKSTPENAEKQTEKKKETLLDTCRLIRQHYRPVPSDTASLSTFSKIGINGRRVSWTLPKSVINTPFYIRVSPSDVKSCEGTSKL